MRPRWLWAVLASATACAAQQKPAQTTMQQVVPVSQVLAKDGTVVGGVGPKGNFVCDMETPLGSHMAQRVCRYVDEDEASMERRLRTQDALRTHPVCAAQGTDNKCH